MCNMFYNYNYLSQKNDNLSRLAFFGSVAYFFSHAAYSDHVKRTFYNQRLPVINVFPWQSEIY